MTTVPLAPLDEATLLPGFDDEAFSQVTEAQALLKAKRIEGFAAYASLPMPTARHEEWRRTDPALFPFPTWTAPRALVGRKPGPPGPMDALFDVVVEVNDSGFSVLDQSGALAAGRFTVCPLDEAASRYPALVQPYLQGPARTKGARKFMALNDAFWNVGLLIHVPARTVVEKGILVRYDHGAAGAVLPRLLVVVDEQSEVTVAEHYQSDDAVALLAVGAREMYVARGSTLKVVSLQEWGHQTFHIGEDWAQVERDAKIDWVTLLLGGRVSKMMVGCDLHQENSNAYLSGLFFADGNQHVDQRTLQLHSAPHTYSNLLYKGAVKDQGHSVYQGIIDAAPGAIKVDAYQMNRNLVLNDGARADSLPGLEIDADDLKCSHGSTMGNLDPDQVFYLQSRGLSAAEARRLLVMAFFEEVIEKVPYEFMRERVRAHVKKKMG
jgi:Fe-S cluster assembly protein SufD